MSEHFALFLAPPHGIGPAQAAFVLARRVDADTLRATLLYGELHEAVRIEAGEVVETDLRRWQMLDVASNTVGFMLERGAALDECLGAMRGACSRWLLTAGLGEAATGPRKLTADALLTPAGQTLRSQVGGFRDLLRGAGHSVDPVVRRSLYADYVPWALALGVEQEWAAQCGMA